MSLNPILPLDRRQPLPRGLQRGVRRPQPHVLPLLAPQQHARLALSAQRGVRHQALQRAAHRAIQPSAQEGGVNAEDSDTIEIVGERSKEKLLLGR